MENFRSAEKGDFSQPDPGYPIWKFLAGTPLWKSVTLPMDLAGHAKSGCQPSGSGSRICEVV